MALSIKSTKKPVIVSIHEMENRRQYLGNSHECRTIEQSLQLSAEIICKLTEKPRMWCSLSHCNQNKESFGWNVISCSKFHTWNVSITKATTNQINRVPSLRKLGSRVRAIENNHKWHGESSERWRALCVFKRFRNRLIHYWNLLANSTYPSAHCRNSGRISSV